MLVEETLSLEDLGEILSTASEASISSDVDAGKRIYAINKIKREIEKLEEQKKEYDEWFKSRVEKREETIEFLKTQLTGYLEAKNEKSLALPVGKVIRKSVTRRKWPEDNDYLVTWSLERKLEVTQKITPNKTAILEYIENGGEAPSNFTQYKEQVTYVHE